LRAVFIVAILSVNIPWLAFVGLDADGNLGGLIAGFSTNCSITNCCVIFSGLILELHCKDMDKYIKFYNIYGPYGDYEDY
jgi:hypothetical protein